MTYASTKTVSHVKRTEKGEKGLQPGIWGKALNGIQDHIMGSDGQNQGMDKVKLIMESSKTSLLLLFQIK